MSELTPATVPLDRAPFTWKTLTAIANTEFVPAALRGKPAALLAAILTGRELGLGPMESLRSIDVIDGRPSPSAEWMTARIFEAGHTIEVIEQTDQVCTIKGTRYVLFIKQGEPQREPVVSQTVTFTIEMAERARLTGKFNWKAYPEAMLYWRAVAQLARQLFPDVLRGIKHLPEELGDDSWIEATPLLEEGQAVVVDENDGTVTYPSQDDDVVVTVWAPEPTGKDDATIIEFIADHPDTEELVRFTLASWDTWKNGTVDDIQGEVRLIYRGMEALGIWEGENTLRDDLTAVGVNHLGEIRKADLITFAEAAVTKAMIALREEKE